jgi:hypothetical protein
MAGLVPAIHEKVGPPHFLAEKTIECPDGYIS